MSRQGLDALRARVHADAELARRLRAIAPEVFEAELLQAAAESGADVTQADIVDAIRSARQAWMMRWIR